MKIKIKDPSITLGSHFWISCLYIVLFIIIFIPLLQDKGAFSWAAYNQISAEICEGEGLMCVLVFKVLPWGFFVTLGHARLLHIQSVFFHQSKKQPAPHGGISARRCKIGIYQTTVPGSFAISGNGIYINGKVCYGEQQIRLLSQGHLL
ncbi:MAG: hypothetical protein MR039_05435 [Elusimicrobia bacterium]|nr:hypothetical protein [Elusimicrobiota bacterium]MCI7044514.1 hypothetical protein [Spirochaetota bacterium]MDD7502232.1 hypothetical protein [Elusimicrobiota bacterium]MDY5729799.1 hypothetical protein [Elusimicrobiaceae bacterium]